VPRGRTEIRDFRDDETLRVSNHLTPRVKPTRTVNDPRFVNSAQSETPQRRIKDLNPMLMDVAERYCSKSDFSMKPLEPVVCGQ